MDAVNGNLIVAVIIGIGLSAACGFRVFVPMLVMSVAAKVGQVQLASGFGWMASWPAIIAFSTATMLEICAYYVPWVDNVMDSIASPAAVVAGTILTSSMILDLSPFMKWTLAIVAGGGSAALVQGATVIVRGISTGMTGGFGNFMVSTVELLLSVATAILAVFLPVLCLLILLVVFYKALRILFGSYFRRGSTPA